MSVPTTTTSSPAENAASATPTLREAGHRARFWLIAGVGALLVAVVGTVLAGGGGAGGAPLGADSAAPAGALALIEVLRDQGVIVQSAETLAETERLAGAVADPTVFFFDENGYLTADQLRAMSALAPRTIVASPDFLTLQTLTPSVGFGGVSQAEVSRAACPVTAAVKADTLSPGGPTLTIPAGAASLTGCFASGENAFALIEQVADDQTLTLLADGTLFNNERIVEAGNAALALNLLGAGEELIWYLPTIADVPGTGSPSLGELTPGWVTPTLLLLVLVFLASSVWRGRRFGPLVAENLPVTVRASETMEGRARLYARSNARLRAVDALRIGAVQRLAGQVGLSRLASLDDVIGMVATVTERSPKDVRAVLVDAVPASDSELVALSDRIQELERATHRSTTPLPPGRMDS